MAKSTGIIGNITIRSCRACLDSKPKEYVSLNSDDWLDIYKFCVDDKIAQSPLSHLLCAECCRLVKQFSEFKLKCQQSELFWQRLFNKNTKCQLGQPDNNVKVKIKDEDGAFDYYAYEFLEPDMEDINTVADVNNDSQAENNIVTEIKKKLEQQDNITEKCTVESLVQGSGQAKRPLLKKYSQFRVKKEYGIEKKFIGYCSNCKRKFVSKNYLSKHLSTCFEKKAGPDDYIYCGLCDSSHKGYPALNEHLVEHYNNNNLKCQTCEYTGRDFADMLGHRWEQHHRQTSFNGKCILCKVKLLTITTALFHFRAKHMGKKGGLCKYCDFTTSSRSHFREHQTLHEVAGFPCTEKGCKRRFTSKIRLNWHINCEQHNTTNSKYICETCGYKTYKHYSLKMHLLIHNREAVKCTHCTKTFQSQLNLKRHMRRVTDEKRFVCAICSKQYTLACDLKEHMRWHSDEKPFKCDQCGKCYKARSTLTEHVRNTHLGVRPFKCTECTSEFPAAVRLRRHMAIHTGVKPHQCKLCNKGFYSPMMLMLHMKARHGLGID